MALLGCTLSSASCADGADWTAVHVCPECRERFVPIEPPCCAVCGEPAEGSFIPSGLCARCAETAPSFEEARAAYVNEGALRELLLASNMRGPFIWPEPSRG